MFTRKSTNGGNAIAAIERELADLQTRRSTLQARLVDAERAVAQAIDARLVRLLESDIDDHNGQPVRNVVTELRDEAAAIGDAIVAVNAKISDAQARLAGEHDKIARQAEAKTRIKDADTIEMRVGDFQRVAKLLSESLAGITAIEPRTEHFRAVIARVVTDISGSVNEAIGLTRGYAANIETGGTLLKQPIPVPIPKAPPPVARQNLMLLVPGKWREGDDILTAGGGITVSLPIHIAQQALTFGHAIEPSSDRARRARELEPPDYGIYPPDHGSLIDIEKPLPTPAPPSQRTSDPVVHSAVIMSGDRVSERKAMIL